MMKPMRMPGRCALALAIGLAFSAPAAYGAGLGRITVQSALGQPLRAEVEVTAVSREEAASLAVKLASIAAYRQANLEYNPALSGLRVTLGQRTESGYVVRLSSPNPVNEPYLDLLLELSSSSGRVLREYTILLDPPALRAAPEVVAPAAARAAAPAPAPAPAAATPAPRPAAPPASASTSTYAVQRGDTLGSIAERTRPASASRDQMLVALFRSNPEAFIGGNMNNLRAGSVLKVPEEQQVLGIEQATARREIAAQSADFARYRSRLAQAATEAGPGAVAAAGQGRVTTQVQDSGAEAAAGDQLKIAQAAATAKAGDEAVARDRQIKDLLDRVAELERTNQQLQKALELQSKTGAQVQAAAEGKPAAAPESPAAPAPAPAPVAAAPSAAPPAPAAAPVAPAAPAAPPAPAEAPKAAAPKAATPPAEEPGMLSSLVGSNLPLVAGLGVVLAGLVGYSLYRRRKPAGEEEFDLGAEATHGNSLFGQTGGRSVDTGAVSSFNSSFVPAATQVDASDVDPVAEADVYIAYGREEQAEDILKEALRVQPDRHPVRVKLMEILARRGDKAGFARHASDLMTRTGGTGEDWERAAAIGRSIDPTNSMFSASTAAMAEMIRSDTMAELNLETTKPHHLPSETVGFRAPPATLGGEATELDRSAMAPGARQAADSVTSVDSRISADTLLPLDSKAATEAPTVTGAAMSPSRAPADLSALEFESMTTMPSTRMIEPEPEPVPAPDKPLDFDFGLPPAADAGKAPKLPELPDLDLSLPPATAAKPETAKPPARKEVTGSLEADIAAARKGATEAVAAAAATAAGAARPRPAPLEETLIQPTLLGGLTAALPEGSTRLMSNTDQATVPLIDFDLSGADLPLTTRPGAGGALTGSQMASQMATKLDLARGYIDLGVKDGARELLDEVMRDGTREQRQAAVELMKQIER